MRGFPPIQIFLLCLAFAALALPLAHLTGDAQGGPVAESGKKASQDVRGLLRARFAHTPSDLSLEIAGKKIITSAGESPMEAGITLPAIESGVDVFLSAKWPDNTPDTAVTIEIEPDGLDARAETRWSSAGGLDEVITFSWK